MSVVAAFVGFIGLSQKRPKSHRATAAGHPDRGQYVSCLLNGQPWTPRGSNGTDNYKVIYDAGYIGGYLDIRAYRYPPGQTVSQYLSLAGSPVTAPGTYPLDGGKGGAYYSSGLKGACSECTYRTPGIYMRGQLVVTRLDLRAGIISGTFAFTLSQPGCDTVKVTQDRFDKKL